MAEKIRNAVNQAYTDIAKCNEGDCGGTSAGATNFKRQWMFAMLTGNYYCGRAGHPLRLPVLGAGKDGPWQTINVWSFAKLEAEKRDAGWEGMLNLGDNMGTEAWTLEGARNFVGGRNMGLGDTVRDGSCLAKVLAHEAAHGAYNSLPAAQWKPKSNPTNKTQFFAPYFGGREAWALDSKHKVAIPALEECIKCRQ